MAEWRRVERTGRDQLGEGPVWLADRGLLLWVDIMAPAVHSLHLASGAITTCPVGERVGWVLPRAGRRDFVAGLKSGFKTFDLDTGAVTAIGDPEPDRPHNRLNDAKIDSHGRIWAGSKDDRDEEESGALYRLDPDLRWSLMDDGYAITNGPTFDPAGTILYHTDSIARTVYAFDLAADGAISGKRVFLRFEDAGWGVPDGMTTDAEGCLWIAHWGGGRISRFDPSGRWMRSIALPAANVTSCAFAGPDLDRLFVTSAADGSPGGADDGALFEVETGVRGLPMRAFAG